MYFSHRSVSVSYTHLSADLKNWEYKSHVTGFWECPELFELPVDGDKNHTKWVMYGASGTYMPVSYTHLDVYKRQAIDRGCLEYSRGD